MTAAEITRHAMKYGVNMTGVDSLTGNQTGYLFRGDITADHIDTINNRFVLDGLQMSGIEGNAYLEFQDFYFQLVDPAINRPTDTIAYIPNSQREAIYEQCLPLEEQGKWGEIYSIFLEGFNFVPCTGKEFREMKKAGTN